MPRPAHHPPRSPQYQPQASRPTLAPPGPGAPPIVAEDEIAPGQVWAGLSLALRAELRQRTLRILREVTADER